MAVLKAAARRRLKSSQFALPGRRYPINDPEHAKSALARVQQLGTPDEIKKVRAAVRRRFPAMTVAGKK